MVQSVSEQDVSMKIKLLYVVLFSVAAIAITANVAYAASLTNTLASPSNNIYNKGAQYMVKFTTATTGTITSIDIVFPPEFKVSQADGVIPYNIGPGTLTNSGSGGVTPTVTYTVTNPVSVSSGTPITLFLAKFTNTSDPGSYTLSYTVHYSGGANDTGTAPFTVSNTFGGFKFDNSTADVFVGGNIISTSGSGLAIKSNAGGAICIGNGC